MNILKDYLKDDELKAKNKLVEAKAVYELDEEKRYERLLARLKLSNPKLHSKIINLD
jgi:hypothetical protein